MFGGKLMDTFMDKLASKFNAQEMIRANSAAEARENERLQKEVEAYKQCLQEMREISLQNTATADEVAELVKASLDKIAAIQVESGKSDDVLVAMKTSTDDVLGAMKNNADDVIGAMQGKSEDVLNAVRNSAGETLSAVKMCSDEVQGVVNSKSDMMLSSIRGALNANTERVMTAVEGSSEKVLSELQAGNDGFKEAIKAELLAEIKKEIKSQEENVHKECVKVYRNVQAIITEETQKQTEEIIAAQSKGGKKATAALVCGILAMAFAALGLAVSVMDVLGVFAMLF